MGTPDQRRQDRPLPAVWIAGGKMVTAPAARRLSSEPLRNSASAVTTSASKPKKFHRYVAVSKPPPAVIKIYISIFYLRHVTHYFVATIRQGTGLQFSLRVPLLPPMLGEGAERLRLARADVFNFRFARA